MEAIALALRLNPPKTPEDPIETHSTETNTLLAENTSTNIPHKTEGIIIKTEIPEKPKFHLVGTVVCIDRPERSLALMQLSNGKLKWFYKGERLGRFYLDDIHDGRTIMIRGSEKTELTVPPKPSVRKLTKDSNASI